ncbi:MAG: ROK family protein, partial [Myxococcales bacterium]|nr:ROK family protein [Myxococcales bacterium]
ELARRRVATPAGDYGATVAAVAGLVHALEAETAPGASVGVGIPGTLSPATGVVKNANSTWLIGHALDHDLAAALGRPVRLANDANCFAVSEAVDGAAAGHRVVFGVILGTGVGGGLVFEGRAWRGANAIGGEWGHNPLPRMRDDERPGPRCYCGRLGCLEAFLCGRGLVQDHLLHHGEGALDDAKAIGDAADAGDPVCLDTLERYAERLARSLAVVINVFDPHAIVLGGGLSNCKLLYHRVPELWVGHVFSDAIATKLLPPAKGDSSGTRGAAWLF